MFFWVFPRRQIVVGRRFGTLYLFHLQRLVVDCHSLPPAFEDGTDTGFRNVGQLQFEAGEIPKRTFSIFKSRRKSEIKNFGVGSVDAGGSHTFEYLRVIKVCISVNNVMGWTATVSCASMLKLLCFYCAFACVEWAWNLVSYSEGGTWAEGVRE